VPGWQERVVVAYLDEPPFGIPAPGDARPSGADMDLADHVLRGAGASTVDYRLTTFPHLIPGLLDGRWQMTTPIFVTAERAEVVRFSRPVWAAADGFIVRRADTARYTSYEAIAADGQAVLAVVRGQVQHRTALDAGIPHERIVEFPDQGAAAAAVGDGRVDASASTAAGNRAYVQRASDAALAVVADRSPARRDRLPRGAFAFAPDAAGLAAAVDDELRRFLGTSEHLRLVAGYGFSAADHQGLVEA
jgi:polar amino acid transport system substrate-binding protein